MKLYTALLLCCILALATGASIGGLGGHGGEENKLKIDGGGPVEAGNGSGDNELGSSIVIHNATFGQYFQCYANISALGNDTGNCWAARFLIPGIPVVFFSLVAVSIGIGICCCYNRYKRSDSYQVNEEANNRRSEEEIERANAKQAVDYYLELVSRQTQPPPKRSWWKLWQKEQTEPLPAHVVYRRAEKDLPDMGSRMQKYWFKIVPTEPTDGVQPRLLTIAPIPRHCPLLEDGEQPDGEQPDGEQPEEKVLPKETVDNLNVLVKKLKKHPCVHPVYAIGYLRNRKQVIIIQPFLKKHGSLKDRIYGVRPARDWANKYPKNRGEAASVRDEESEDVEPDEVEEAGETEGEISEGEDDEDDEDDGNDGNDGVGEAENNEEHDDQDADTLADTEDECCCSRCCTRCYKKWCSCCTCCFKSSPRTYARGSRRQSVLSADDVELGPAAWFELCGPRRPMHRPPSSKRMESPKGLPVGDIQKYGWQILKTMGYLYSQGFPVLGHVQSGNVFVGEDGVCRVGGYENTLLGYRSRFYRMCRDHLDHMDVIMFGHLVFEMSCAYELTTLEPTEEDYEAVRRREDGGREIEEVLQFIFTERFPNNISAITEHNFFQSAEKLQKLDKWKYCRGRQSLKNVFTRSTSPKKKVLKAVRKGARDDANMHANPGEKRKIIPISPQAQQSTGASN